MAQGLRNANIKAQTVSEIRELLQTKINQSNDTLSNEVIGFTEFNFLGFPNRNPIMLRNLLGPMFSRNFDPSLQSAIEELKQSDAINKKELHPALLEKYFGSKDPSTIDLQQGFSLPAYESIPEKINQDFEAALTEDYYLHLYFLQPFRLFGITDNNRKFIGSNVETKNREWLWHANAQNTDSAIFIRRIIQTYIISDIIECYHEDNGNSELQNDAIKEQLPALTALRTSLLQNTQRELNRLFSHLNAPNINDDDSIEGSPNGLLADNSRADRLLIQLFEMFMPGFMDIALLYPIGRLLFGQPRQEPRHKLAEKNAQHPNKMIRGIQYSFAWLYEHLNISTSLFWIKTSLLLTASIFKSFKEFVTTRNPNHSFLFANSLKVIPNMFIIAATPFLVMLPAIYGMTSLPFTLVRSLALSGPFRSLKNYKFLKGLDIVESIKDIVLFLAYAAPWVGVMLISLNAFIPEALLTAGSIFSVIILIPFLNSSIAIAELASTPFFRFAGALSFVSLTAYLGLALLGNEIAPYVPQSVVTGFGYAIMPFMFMGTQLNNLLSKVFTRNIELTGIVPESPKAKPLPTLCYGHIPKSLRDQADAMGKNLGQINQAFNLSPTRKKHVKDTINKLTLSEESTVENLTKAIEEAQKLLDNNFTSSQAAVMKDLANQLSDLQGTEKAALIQAQNGRQYQPSWKMLESLHNQGFITNDGKWSTAAQNLGCTKEMLDKCREIEGLKERVAP